MKRLQQIMKYIYADFTSSSCNIGNLVIDHATKGLLHGHLPEPACLVDSFDKDMSIPDTYDFLLIPGCTMITDGQNKGLDKIGELRIPVYCLAGSVWTRNNFPGIALRRRVVFKGRNIPSLNIVSNLDGVIGCRDSYTFSLLKSKGFECSYVGCPTLQLEGDVNEHGYALMSFGRTSVYQQVHYGKKLAKKIPVIGIVHEFDDYDRVRASGWDLPLVTYNCDIDLYLSYFRNASLIVTGRLHGALPSIAYGKKIMYFGTKDTRTSILDDLGVRIYGYSDISNGHKLATDTINKATIDRFRSNLLHVIQSIRDRHS